MSLEDWDGVDRFSEIPKSKCGVLAACHHQPLCGCGDVDGEDKVDDGDDDENEILNFVIQT